MMVPAYAATIHKSQGSEYPAVIIPVLTQHYPMLQRNLLYTGITRGKQLVVLVGQKKARRHRGTKRLWPAEVVEAGRVAVPWSIPLAANWVHKLSHGG
jgi:superfamily I DNA/RNA helicase